MMGTSDTEGAKMPKKAKKNGTISNGELTDEEGHYRLTGELFWKYRAVDSDYVRVQAAVLHNKEQINAFIEKTPELRDLFAKKTELMNQSSITVGELMAVQAQIEKLFGVDLKECSIDDKTGVLHVLKDGKEVPMSPPATPVAGVKSPKKRSAGSAQ